MGLSYYFNLKADATKTPAQLESFLQQVEREAKKMGFAPTMVLNACFDTADRRAFARRLTSGLKLECDKLKSVALSDNQVWQHDAVNGFCRVIPQQGVLLIVTNEQGHESAFGFFRFPVGLKDPNGRDVVKTGADTQWLFSDFVDSPDPRYRKIVKLFKDAGYVEKERDEFD